MNTVRTEGSHTRGACAARRPTCRGPQARQPPKTAMYLTLLLASTTPNAHAACCNHHFKQPLRPLPTTALPATTLWTLCSWFSATTKSVVVIKGFLLLQLACLPFDNIIANLEPAAVAKEVVASCLHCHRHNRKSRGRGRKRDAYRARTEEDEGNGLE